MTFEPIYEVATTDTPEKLCSGQVVVEAKMFAPPGITIAKILSVSASVGIVSSEVFVGEVRYSGKVVYKVLLLGSEGEIECLRYDADFSDKLTNNAIERGMKPIFDYRVLDADLTSAEGGELRLAGVVEVDLIKPVRKRVKYLKYGGEGIFTLDRNIGISKECGIGEETVTVSDSVKVNARRLLSDSCRVIVTGKKCSNGFVCVEGKVIGDYCLENNGELSSTTIITPFSSEVSVEGCEENCIAAVRACLTSVTPILNEAEGETSLEVGYTVSLIAIAYRRGEINAVCDAFCPECELLTTTESIKVRRLSETFSAEDCVTGTITLEASDPVADSIIAVCAPSIHISSAFVRDGVPFAEGVINATVLYYSAELNSKNSLNIELPFSLKLNHSLDDDDEADIRAVITECNIKIRRGGELDVRADLIFDVDIYKTDIDSVIGELNTGEPYEPCEAALTVHYARGGEELFDAAKALKTSPENVKAQNSALEFPLKRGDRVICYRHLERN